MERDTGARGFKAHAFPHGDGDIPPVAHCSVSESRGARLLFVMMFIFKLSLPS